MSNHTPGPWAVEARNDWANLYDQLQLVCEVGDFDVVGKNVIGRSDTADAYLIAAAPDMLEALKEAATVLETYIRDLFGSSPTFNARMEIVGRVRDVIAKAQGDI